MKVYKKSYLPGELECDDIRLLYIQTVKNISSTIAPITAATAPSKT